MKIGFDAKRAAFNFTGLGNYSRSLIRNLQLFYPGETYFLYTPRMKAGALDSLLAHVNTILRMPSGWLAKKAGSFWRTFGTTGFLKDRLDIFHGLSGELPLFLDKKVKAVLTVHDLIFIRFPGFYKAADRFIYKKKLQFACQRADIIVAISEQSKQDLIEFMNIDASRIRVIYQGCDDSFMKEASASKKAEVKEKYKLPSHYLLNVGSLEERKNALLILKALVLLPPDVCLVLAGKRTDYTATLEAFIDQNNLKDRVSIHNKITFEDLPAIYQMASVFIYPSLFEGFGIPILEALVSGIPVISSTGSCFSEAGGPGSIYVNPQNSELLAEKIAYLLKNEAARTHMIANGRTFAQNFLPEKLSAQLMELYLNLIKITADE